ncbi:MAG TPA: iron-containing redox enzyme family protein [Gemmataceae bacterium]|jgi:pyrroloquinoline-quinone synthase
MFPSARAPRVTACAEAILRRLDFAANSYLRALADGSLSLEGFRRTQEQFYFAVVYFPRPMAVLLSRLPDPETRMDILHNLVEEHGDFQAEQSHPNTFRCFLHSIGANADAVTTIPVWPAVRAFNAALHGVCAFAEPEVGACCLGEIELAFAGVSAAIGQTVAKRGWVRREDLVHYQLHAEIDTRHAEEFFAVAEPAWDNAHQRLLVEQGLELGAHLFDRLYRELYVEAVHRATMKT